MINLQVLSEGGFVVIYHQAIQENVRNIDIPIVPNFIESVGRLSTESSVEMDHVPLEMFTAPDGQRIKIGISEKHSLFFIGNVVREEREE